MRSLALLLTLSIAGLSGVVRGAAGFPATALPGIMLTQLSDCETSGLVWHAGEQKFFLISDNGFITLMTQSGQVLSNVALAGDLEAVTVVPGRDDYIYIGVEHPDSILEYNIRTRQVTRSFDLTKWMSGPDNAGLEGLAFVCDDTDPEGGWFYAGLQDNGHIYIFSLPIKSSSTSTVVTHLETIKPNDSGISDISYCPSQNIIYAIYDSKDILVAYQPNPADLNTLPVLGKWNLPGKDQEGVAVKGKELYIAQDHGGSGGGDVTRYSPLQLFAQSDLDADGKVTIRDFAALAAKWLQTGNLPTADVDGDLSVDLADLNILSKHWLGGL